MSKVIYPKTFLDAHSRHMKDGLPEKDFIRLEPKTGKDKAQIPGAYTIMFALEKDKYVPMKLMVYNLNTIFDVEYYKKIGGKDAEGLAFNVGIDTAKFRIKDVDHDFGECIRIRDRIVTSKIADYKEAGVFDKNRAVYPGTNYTKKKKVPKVVDGKTLQVDADVPNERPCINIKIITSTKNENPNDKNPRLLTRVHDASKPKPKTTGEYYTASVDGKPIDVHNITQFMKSGSKVTGDVDCSSLMDTQMGITFKPCVWSIVVKQGAGYSESLPAELAEQMHSEISEQMENLDIVPPEEEFKLDTSANQ